MLKEIYFGGMMCPNLAENWSLFFFLVNSNKLEGLGAVFLMCHERAGRE